MLMLIIGLFVLALIVYLIIAYKKNYNIQKELRWDWNAIDTDMVEFPHSFEFGVSASEYQISGNQSHDKNTGKTNRYDSNWSRYERKKNLFGRRRIERALDGIDHWNRYEEDIQLIKQLGVTIYRCSIAWERVQPCEDYYDATVLQHYHTLFDECLANNIKVVLTLHHFVNPGWFEDKGAFEKEENIVFFTHFAERMLSEYGNKVSRWCTINEPGAYAAQTYITHQFPYPTKTGLKFVSRFFRVPSFYYAGLTTKHLLMAHCAIYKRFKNIKKTDDIAVGLAHEVVIFEAYHPKNPIERYVAGVLNHIYHEAVTRFLRTGTFRFKTLASAVTWHYPEVNSKFDFLGINYYSHVLINWRKPTCPQVRPEDDEVPTDMKYGIYAEGLYRVVNEMKDIQKPIYITESGIADARDDRRELWYRRYLYAVSECIKDGADIKMFCAWAPFDNFEWNFGYGKKFGLYSVHPTTYERALRSGSEYFRSITHRHRKLPYKRVT